MRINLPELEKQFEDLVALTHRASFVLENHSGTSSVLIPIRKDQYRSLYGIIKLVEDVLESIPGNGEYEIKQRHER